MSTCPYSLRLIRSGGQTGADRGALDAALKVNFPHHGWCPKGRRAEDGRLSDRYRLTETPSRDSKQRTDLNVRDSDATIILCKAPLSGGSLYTKRCCARRAKPVLVIELEGPDTRALMPFEGHVRPKDDEGAVASILSFLKDTRCKVLNVAGNRESGFEGLWARTESIMTKVFFQVRKARAEAEGAGGSDQFERAEDEV